MLSKDRCLGLMYASRVVNGAVQRPKGCIIFIRFLRIQVCQQRPHPGI